MARKRFGESKNGYFRRLFETHPEWLVAKSNEAVVMQWQADHPGKEMTRQDKQSMANAKSFVRRKNRGGGPGRRKVLARNLSVGNAAYLKGSDLEQLELLIDESLAMARRLDPAGLDITIRSLRRARNEVVWKSGQP
jgi:hypothetical protein